MHNTLSAFLIRSPPANPASMFLNTSGDIHVRQLKATYSVYLFNQAGPAQSFQLHTRLPLAVPFEPEKEIDEEILE